MFTMMAALGHMEHEIKRERVVDSINKRRDAGKDLDGRPQLITDSQIRNARGLIESGETTAQVALDLGMSRVRKSDRGLLLGCGYRGAWCRLRVFSPFLPLAVTASTAPRSVGRHYLRLIGRRSRREGG